MTSLPLSAGVAELRRWREPDLDALVTQANNRAVWRNMTDIFPHPYLRSDGESWIARCLAQRPPQDVVISVDGALVGVCGVALHSGESEYNGMVGYWLGQPHWGRGIATDALAAFVRYVWATFPVTRLEARVFGWNPASGRVLEKNGFKLEGVRRDAIRKDGEITDELVYGLLKRDVVW